MTIDEILHPEDVDLKLKAVEKTSAIEEVLAKLSGDRRVSNWQQLRSAVLLHDPPALTQHGVGICIAHGRSPAVKELVMAAGRSDVGLKCLGTTDPLRIVFVAGVPMAIDSEYLRILGAIARICRDEESIHDLLSVANPSEFIRVLMVGEAKL